MLQAVVASYATLLPAPVLASYATLLPARKPVDCLVVGGGPAGLAAATSLAKRGLGVTLLEKRPTAAAFESARAYLYLVDSRGQQWTDTNGLTDELRELGVSNDGYTITRAFPTNKGAETTKPLLALAAAAKAVWIPRAALLGMMAREAERAGVNLLYGATLEDIHPAAGADDCLTVLASGEDGATHSFAPRLLLGCDGFESRVRAALQAWAPPKVADEYEPVRLPSPSAGLQYKMLLVPPSFELTNLSSAEAPPVVTEAQSAYSIPGRKAPRRKALRFGLLPSKDTSAPRTANVIKPADHAVWQLSTAPQLREYLREQFPQIMDIDAFVSPEEAERFVSGAVPPGAFPAPQFVRRLVGASGASGVALLGDAVHAFPPDLGQGVNSALEDVVVLGESLQGWSPSPGRANGDLVEPFLARYQRARAPAAEALARIQQIGFPYQYGQGPAWREALFAAGFACRLLLSKLNAAVFAPPAAFQILAGEPYDQIWRRCQRTTRLLQLAALAATGALLRLLHLRRVALLV